MSENKTNINWFPGHMAKSLKEIESNLKLVDMIIEIVDARAPLASRNPQIINYNKPRLMILAKKDLANPNLVKNWINYLTNNNTRAIALDLNKGFNEKIVINEINLLLKEKIEKDLKRGIKKRTIRALVVGIPNVGKSTFINKMAKRKAAGVGNKPGFTKTLQWINTSGVDLLDTPGVLWPKFDEQTGLKLALIGSIKEEILDLDVLSDKAIAFLINNYKEAMEKRYNLTNYTKDDVFEKICVSRGLLLKNGAYNLEQAKYLVLKELKEGLITPFCLEEASGTSLID